MQTRRAVAALSSSCVTGLTLNPMHIPLLFLLSALLLWLSSPGPGLSFCAWIALVPLLTGCAMVTPKKAALLGFVSGLLYYLLLVYWVVISLGTYGHLPWWLCGLALLLLSAYMSLYLAFFCAACSWSMQAVAPVWSAPLLWVALDFVRGLLFSGFPWQDLGYSQFNTPLLIQVADLAGHHGITFLIVMANCLLFTLSARWRKKDVPWLPLPTRLQTTTGLLLIAAALAYSFVQLKAISRDLAAAPGYPVAVIQGNIEQNQKWVAAKQREAMETYIELSCKAAQQQPELVIWPETAMPFFPPTSPLFPQVLDRTVYSHHYFLLSGAPYFVEKQKDYDLYNSALLARPDGSQAIYFKQHLVPLGEYIPFSDILPLPGPVVESIGNFSAGSDSQPLAAGKAKLGVLICFESIFPALARQEVANGANLLVNITNDAWFGKSSASIQHMAMAVFRAVENRRSLARAANTGISCFIDPAGRISQATPLFTTCSINGSPALFDQHTVFTRLGYLFPIACLIFLIPVAFWIRIINRSV
ncbi:MAG: apolipoprotein N-acyltransferase [Proteobacteria bacterium]|nr:apolipoprotein N-acyltransferase [Pseudomonadota bacterium]MBU4295931.1 apolipoprotein N-acyltransferase [Pseudomonadota bacterium]MCG2746139.1 apolipoprotein N-acyltransferase [Desulfobulbaceae bacterium]